MSKRILTLSLKSMKPDKTEWKAFGIELQPSEDGEVLIDFEIEDGDGIREGHWAPEALAQVGQQMMIVLQQMDREIERELRTS